jgi:DNA polymerase III subunit epsilon
VVSGVPRRDLPAGARAALAELFTMDASCRASAGIRIVPKQPRSTAPAVTTFAASVAPPAPGGEAAVPLGALEYVVVDVETTGTAAARGHRITEVAAVRMRADGAVVDEFTTLVNPERPIPPFITALTSISWGMVADAPRFADVAGRLRTLLDGAVFVAHNAAFDWGFVSAELQRADGAALSGRMLCTVRMARRLVPEIPRRSLDALTVYFGVANDARHRAYGDARATAEIFRRLLDRAEEREVRSWAELETLLARRPSRPKRRASPAPVPDA